MAVQHVIAGSSGYFAQLLRRMRKQMRIVMEYMLFKHQYGFLLPVPPVPSKGTVLMVSLAHWGPQVKMQAIILKSLQLEGYTPVILTYRRYTWAQRYFRACGLSDFLHFDDLMTEVASSRPTGSVEQILGTQPTFAGLFAFAFDGVKVGRHALSSIVRGLAQGSVEFGDPRVTELLTKLLPDSMQQVKASRLLFERIQPDAVLFVEKGYLPYGVIFDVAIEKNLNVVQFHHGHRSDLILMKRYTDTNRYQHSFSVSPKSWQRLKDLAWRKADEDAFMAELEKSYHEGSWFNRKFLLTNKQVKSPEEVRAQLGLDPAKKTSVIFSHVLWDATFFFGENLFPDYEQWLIATVKAACENDKVNWLIKLHPDYVWKMKSMGDTRPPRDIIALQMNIGTLPDHVKIVPPDIDISTYAFFPITDYCITVRGTIGIEAPCFGIPVFTAGTGRYSGLGFTNDSKTAEEYLDKMKRIQEFPRLMPEQTTLARKHAYGLFMCRPLSIKTVEMVPRPGANFSQDLVIRARSPEDIRNAEDLKIFRQWAMEGKEEDYLSLA